MISQLDTANPDKMRILNEFAANTSIAPIPAIGRAKSFKVKMLWALVFGIAIGILVYQAGDSVRRYLEYSKNIEINLKPKSASFPWITLCNSEYIGYNAGLVAEHDDGSKEHEIMKKLNISTLSLIPKLAIPYKSYKDSKEEEPFQTYQNMQYNLTQVLFDQAQMAVSIPDFKNLNFSIPLEHLKALCKFGDNACQDVDFHEVFDPYFFKCYTYKPDENIAVTEGNGLGLVLFSDAGLNNPYQMLLEGFDIFFKASLKSKGMFNMNIDHKTIKVFVHPPNTKPGYYRESIDIGQGQYTKIVLKETLIKRITTPKENCQKGKATRWEGIDYKETFADCQRQCVFDYVKKTCGCHLPEEVIGMDNRNNVTVCFSDLLDNLNHFLDNYNNLTPSEQVSGFLDIQTNDLCGKNAYDKVFTNMRACHCDLPCEERDYAISSSSLPWPKHIVDKDLTYGIFDDIFRTNKFSTKFSKYEQIYMEKTYGINFSKIDNEYVNNATIFPIDEQEHILQHFTLVDIHFSNTDVQMIKEKRAYEITTLFSDFGGLIGLWVGITFITAFEVVELIIHTLMTYCKATPEKEIKRQSRYSKDQDIEETPMSCENSGVNDDNRQEVSDMSL